MGIAVVLLNVAPLSDIDVACLNRNVATSLFSSNVNYFTIS